MELQAIDQVISLCLSFNMCMNTLYGMLVFKANVMVVLMYVLIFGVYC